jgi:small subunit ribosomal protein S2
MEEETEKTEEKKEQKSEFGLDLEKMAEAGLHFGHKTSKIHPKMKPYLEGVRNGIHTINLEKSKEKLEEMLKFIGQFVADKKTLLLVGTKIQFKGLIKEIAEEAGIFYVAGRWLGGTFTNFKTIKKRIDYFKDLESQKAKGELEKYTKKERAKIDKEIKDLEERLGGIKNMDKLPDAIFVVGMDRDISAIKEAKKKGVTILAIADTNVDPLLASRIVPANDDAISSVRYVLEKVKEVIIKNKK